MKLVTIKIKNQVKTNLLKVAFVAAIAMVSGINVFYAQKSEVLPDIILANVEALAEEEASAPCLEVCYRYDGWSCTRITNGVSSVCIPYRKK